MNPTSPSRTEEASQLALAAQTALAAGDTDRARDLHRAAGDLLLSGISRLRKRSEQDSLRFLAATQYYLAGSFSRAQQVCRKIEERYLADSDRRPFREFRQRVNEQATAGYDDKIRNSLKSLWEGNDHRRILELLAENPYVLSRSDLAFFRAICCEQLHDYRGAALFFADALKWGANDPDMLGHSVAAAIMMTYERRLAEAELYLNHLLELVPHALTFAAASILRLYQAKAARNDDQRRSLMREQLRLCESAGAAFSDLPETQSQSPSSRAWMVLCLECASFAALGLGDRQKALGFSDRALVLAPSKSGPYTSRGTISYPSRQAVEDFLSAERLGEKSYISCYYLAHDALTRNEFRDAEQWCGKALRRSPGIKIKAQLYEWLAICRAEAHSDPNEIRTLFHLAKDLDPKNPRIEQNYSLFESSLSISQPNQERPGWEEIVPQPPDPLQEQDDLVSAYALPDSKIAFEMHSKFVGRVTRQAA